MSAFGVFGDRRREELRALAWLWLLREASNLKGKHLRADAYFKRVRPLPKLEHHDFDTRGREFCDDLVEAVLGMPQRHEEGVTIRLASEVRNAIAYQILLGLMASDGVRIDANFKKNLEVKAHEMGVSHKDLVDLHKMLMRDLLSIALNGD